LAAFLDEAMIRTSGCLKWWIRKIRRTRRTWAYSVTGLVVARGCTVCQKGKYKTCASNRVKPMASLQTFIDAKVTRPKACSTVKLVGCHYFIRLIVVLKRSKWPTANRAVFNETRKGSLIDSFWKLLGKLRPAQSDDLPGWSVGF
jgi:hypothetical protein